MSGVSQVQILSRSRKARNPSGFIHWSPPCHGPFFPGPDFVYGYEPPSLPVTPVTILSRSSSLPSSFFHHRSSTAPTAAEEDCHFPGTGRSNFLGAVVQQEHDANKCIQRRRFSRRIHAAGTTVVDQEQEDSVEVTTVQSNGNRETKKLVSTSRNTFSTRKYEKVAGSYRKSDRRQVRGNNGEPCLYVSTSQPMGARKAKAELEDEKWAGPAYSKSPPPSSLPLPSFSVPVRSLSMDAAFATGSNGSSNCSSNTGGSPSSECVDNSSIGLTSPSPEASCNCWDAAFATKDLKRILNLDQQVTS